MPDQTEDAAMGEWVYCAAHLRPHRTGWCTVPARDKTPLETTGTGSEAVQAAYAECRQRGLRLYEDGRNA